VFVGFDVIISICWWTLYVETHGRTLEEMEWVYDQAFPPKAARMVTKVAIGQEGRIEGVVEN
jgi:hypothetical protein